MFSQTKIEKGGWCVRHQRPFLFWEKHTCNTSMRTTRKQQDLKNETQAGTNSLITCTIALEYQQQEKIKITLLRSRPAF
jgi:hypothetical protein